MSARNMAKRTAAGTLALAVCLGGGAIALASAASADAGFKFDQRIEGSDRYGTAIAASKAAFDKADNVILVNGYATVDGLTASYLAGVANAPILYVSDKGADDATKAEIKRLGAKNIWLVGGEKVIPASVADAIKGDGYSVTRINGSDRYETAALIAEAGIKIAGKKPSTVFVASGTSFADALAVSPVAFVKGYPIILTDKDSTSDFSKKELGVIGTDSKVLVGGEAVVSKKVQADLSIKDEQRVAGSDRAVTANLVSDWAKKSQGFNPANAALVGGTNGNGADSLVAAPLLGKSFTTLHFAGWDATNVYLKDHASELTGKGFVFGGKAAVSDDQVNKAQSAAQSIVNTQAYKVATDGKTTVTVSDGDNAGIIQYTASGLGSDKVNIALLKTSDVVVDKDGNVWLKVASASSKVASLNTADHATITVVNGVGNSAATANGIKPSNGSVSFTVDSDTPESVIPVVFSAADDNTDLSISSDTIKSLTVNSVTGNYARVKESFGTGTKATWNPAAAKTDDYSGFTVDAVDTTAKTIQANDGTDYYTFTYGVAGSSYIYAETNDTKLSVEQFAAVISKGDTFDVNYNASGPSDFELTADKPATPASVKAAYGETLNSGNGGVKVTWSPSVSGATDGYKVYRSEVKDGVVSDTAVDVTAGGTLTHTSTLYTFIDPTASAGTYVYTVAAAVGPTVGDKSDPTAQVIVPKGSVPGAVAGAPQIVSSILNETGGTAAFTADAGDAWQILFNEPTSGGASAGTSFRVSDGTTSATVTVGVNAVAHYAPAGTYSVNGKSVTVKDGQLLVVRLIDAPANPSIANNSIAYPASIAKITSNVVDKDEANTVDLGKGDLSLDGSGSATLATGQTGWTEVAPTAVTPTATGSSAGAKTVSVSVTGGTGVTGWNYKLINSAGTVVDNYTTTDATHVSHVFSNVTLATGYTVKVTAYNSTGKASAVSGSVNAA